MVYIIFLLLAIEKFHNLFSHLYLNYWSKLLVILLFIPLITEIRVPDETAGYPRVQIYEQGHNRSYKKVQRFVIISLILLHRHYTEG